MTAAPDLDARRAGLDRIAIVGASLAGLSAAEALREAGFEGAVTLVGAEAHLPYDRPPLSKQVLAGDRDGQSTALRIPERYDELKLDLLLGRAAARLDATAGTLELQSGESVGYDGLIIATGASPRTLPATPELDGIHTLRTLEDCLALRREFEAGPRVAVVGAGFIGAEVAAVARGRGLDVTVLEAAPVPLERAIGAAMGRVCAALHTAHGVDLRLGVAVEDFDGSARIERVRLGDGSSIEADVVVVGVGVDPNTAWLEGSGLVLDNGIVCDATCATNVPGIFAAGDVASWHNRQYGEQMRVEHWTNAVEQGRAAARNLLAGPLAAEPFSSVPYFWSNQYDTRIQFVGHARPDDEVRVAHGAVDDDRFVALYGRAGRLVAALGFNWARLVMGYRAKIAEGIGWDEALDGAASLE
ncbi:MAG: FAD-dependent oxidoreductase [Dehalococcoidia bacterium]|nr:FAD-dependent oxidoreductase [Dehalococcoidia bacterium]